MNWGALLLGERLAHSPTGPDNKPLPWMSIIIPVHNDTPNLAQCLAALRAGATPDSESIVVDDASSEGSPVVAQRAGARVVCLPQNSCPAAKCNRGVTSARGDLSFERSACRIRGRRRRNHIPLPPVRTGAASRRGTDRP